MPKKAQTRSSRTRQRPRRPAPQTAPTGDTATAVPVAPAAPAATTAVAESARRAATRRPSARKVPALAINYDYLSRDLRHLAILAPAMIVLVVVAFFIFH